MKLSTVFLTAALLLVTACGSSDEPPQQPQATPAPIQPQPGQPQTGQPQPNQGACTNPQNTQMAQQYSCSYNGKCYNGYPVCCQSNNQGCYIFVSRCGTSNGGYSGGYSAYSTCQTQSYSLY